MTGTYTIRAGDNSSDLSVASFVQTSPVTDIYGNVMTSSSLPSTNIADGSALVVDGGAPTSTISAIAYDSSNNTITLTGTDFDTIDSATNDVKGQLNWDNFTWDIDGDGATTAGLKFELADIDTAIKTSATILTITLDTAGQTKITNALAAGFGADAIGADAANAADNVDITAGFIRDASLNAATTDAASNLSPTYSDNVAPTISSFSTTTADGSYGIGDTVNITATTSETVLKGSAITATLNNNVNVVLTAAANGTSLVGTYTIQAGDTASPDLGCQFLHTNIKPCYRCLW